MNARHGAEARDALRTALAALPELVAEIGRDAAQREARRELPFEGFALFRRSSLGVLRIPVERGGIGGTLVDLFDTIATLAAADSNLAHALRIHYDLTETLRLSPRTPFNDVQLERALAGAIFGGASTERGTPRPGENTTVLRRDGDHHRVTGRKYYSTGHRRRARARECDRAAGCASSPRRPRLPRAAIARPGRCRFRRAASTAARRSIRSTTAARA